MPCSALVSVPRCTDRRCTAATSTSDAAGDSRMGRAHFTTRSSGRETASTLVLIIIAGVQRVLRGLVLFANCTCAGVVYGYGVDSHYVMT